MAVEAVNELVSEYRERVEAALLESIPAQERIEILSKVLTNHAQVQRQSLIQHESDAEGILAAAAKSTRNAERLARELLEDRVIAELARATKAIIDEAHERIKKSPRLQPTELFYERTLPGPMQCYFGEYIEGPVLVPAGSKLDPIEPSEQEIEEADRNAAHHAEALEADERYEARLNLIEDAQYEAAAG